MVKSAALLFWLFVVLWCAFGVVEQADHLSDLLGESLGTLVLTLSIVTVEVALIAAVMLDSHARPALGRDTMFAVLMIVLNGVVGLVLLLGRTSSRCTSHLGKCKTLPRQRATGEL
jgi:Ca2+:H+ antiporter